ncbi:MAG: FHA domain-containing protein [Planctomycetes bacterium]|nr:FHA domain-containing protein [Planctomycetota bacterium]
MKLFELLWDAREGAEALDERHGRAWLIDDRIYAGLSTQGESTDTSAALPSVAAEVSPLGQDIVVVGSAPGMDLQITARGVSARHASIERRPGDIWAVRDLSTGGTTVDGVPVPARIALPIRPGAVLGLGVARLRLTTSVELLEALGPLIAALPENQPLPEGTNIMIHCSSIGSVLLPPGKPLTLGRAQDAALTLPHPNVSRYHATLTRMGDRVQVMDLNSSNGTFLGSKRLGNEPIWLDPGGPTLGVGPFDLNLRTLSGDDAGEETAQGTEPLTQQFRLRDLAVKGKIEVLPLTQLLQSIELNERSGTVTVEGGKVAFWQGKPLWATHDERTGASALQSLLSLAEGDFTFDIEPEEKALPQAPDPAALLEGNFTGALIENTRVRDEAP